MPSPLAQLAKQFRTRREFLSALMADQRLGNRVLDSDIPEWPIMERSEYLKRPMVATPEPPRVLESLARDLTRQNLGVRWEIPRKATHDPGIAHYDTVGGRQLPMVIQSQPGFLWDNMPAFSSDPTPAAWDKAVRDYRKQLLGAQLRFIDLTRLRHPSFDPYDPFIEEYDDNLLHPLFYSNDVEGSEAPFPQGVSPTLTDFIEQNPHRLPVDPVLRELFNTSLALPKSSRVHRGALKLKRSGGTV